MIFVVINEFNERFQIFYPRPWFIQGPFQIAPHPIDLPDIFTFHITRFSKRLLDKLRWVPECGSYFKKNDALIIDLITDVQFGPNIVWWTNALHPIFHCFDNINRIFQVQSDMVLRFMSKFPCCSRRYFLHNYIRMQLRK